MISATYFDENGNVKEFLCPWCLSSDPVDFDHEVLGIYDAFPADNNECICRECFCNACGLSFKVMDWVNKYAGDS